MLIKCSTIFQVHHGQPGGDVHGAADAVQQDVRHGPGAEDGWARRGPVTAQTRIRTAPVSKACSIFFTLILLLVIFSLFSVILCGPGRHIHLPPQLQFGTVLRFYCSQWSRARRGRVKIRAEIAQFSLFSPLHFPPSIPVSDQQQTGLMSNILGYCEPRSRSYLSSIINGIISTAKKIISPLRRG